MVGITVAVEVRSAAVIMEAVVIMEVAVTEVAATGAEVIMEAGATEAVATAEADMVAVDTGADMDITDAIQLIELSHRRQQLLGPVAASPASLTALKRGCRNGATFSAIAAAFK